MGFTYLVTHNDNINKSSYTSNPSDIHLLIDSGLHLIAKLLIFSEFDLNIYLIIFDTALHILGLHRRSVSRRFSSTAASFTVYSNNKIHKIILHFSRNWTFKKWVARNVISRRIFSLRKLWLSFTDQSMTHFSI